MLVDTWEDLLKVYSRTSRFSLVYEKGKKKVLFYYVALYFFISALSLLLVIFHPGLFVISAAIIIVSAWLIGLCIDRLVDSSLKLGKGCLSRQERLRIKRYENFKAAVISNFPEAVRLLPSLIEWHEVRVSRYRRFSPATHSITLLLLGALLSVFTMVDFVKDNAASIALLAIVVLVVALVLLEFFVEIWTSKERSAFEVNQFLKWMVIEIGEGA